MRTETVDFMSCDLAEWEAPRLTGYCYLLIQATVTALVEHAIWDDVQSGISGEWARLALC